MKALLEKLNYKGNDRIAVLNSEENFTAELLMECRELTIDREIDPRYPYSFIIIFVRNQSEVETFTPIALHNLFATEYYGFVIRKRAQRNSIQILTVIMDGKDLMMLDFMVSGWFQLMKTGLL